MARKNNIKNLSMGMSSDFREAILFGATTLELVKLLWENVLVKKSSIISIISNNEDLLDLLEEAFFGLQVSFHYLFLTAICF